MGIGGGYAIFAGAPDCNNTIDASGSTNNINGGVHTNDELKISGSNTVINGSTTYVNALQAHPSTVFNPPAVMSAAITTYPVPYQITDFRPGGSAAAAAGVKYYDFSALAPGQKVDMGPLTSLGYWNSATKTLKAGLYYAKEDIDLSASEITGNVTFVTDVAVGVSKGVISFSGSNHNLTPFSNGLLAYSTYQKQTPLSQQVNCESPGVKFAGSTHNWAGTSSLLPHRST